MHPQKPSFRRIRRIQDIVAATTAIPTTPATTIPRMIGMLNMDELESSEAVAPAGALIDGSKASDDAAWVADAIVVETVAACVGDDTLLKLDIGLGEMERVEGFCWRD